MNVHIEKAAESDLPGILDLQKRAFSQEAIIYDSESIPPLRQTLEEMRDEFQRKIFWKAVADGKLVGSVRAWQKEGVGYVERLIVDPGAQNRGIGRRLMETVERELPGAVRLELFTGHKSKKNLYLYRRLGYQIVRMEQETGTLSLVYLSKPLPASSGKEARKPRDFDREAASWDVEPRRRKLARDIVAAIRKEVSPTPSMDVLDFGCGTGLVGLALRPEVRSLTCVDTSQGMLDAVRAKVEQAGWENVALHRLDLALGETLPGNYDLIVSAMAMHHILDTVAVIGRLVQALRPGGRLCLADLDTEDGSFHTDPTGVYHHGFDREALGQILEAAGLRDVGQRTAATIGKPTGDFTVFLLSARKG